MASSPRAAAETQLLQNLLPSSGDGDRDRARRGGERLPRQPGPRRGAEGKGRESPRAPLPPRTYRRQRVKPRDEGGLKGAALLSLSLPPSRLSSRFPRPLPSPAGRPWAALRGGRIPGRREAAAAGSPARPAGFYGPGVSVCECVWGVGGAAGTRR